MYKCNYLPKLKENHITANIMVQFRRWFENKYFNVSINVSSVGEVCWVCVWYSEFCIVLCVFIILWLFVFLTFVLLLIKLSLLVLTLWTLLVSVYLIWLLFSLLYAFLSVFSLTVTLHNLFNAVAASKYLPKK